VTDASLPFGARFRLALRVLTDGTFAARAARSLGSETPALPEATAPEPARGAATSAADPRPDYEDGALVFLSLLQREGRLVDFLKQPIDGFGDADVGAAARVVHSGCRKALLSHVELARVREEAEGANVTLSKDEGATVRLTGDVRGSPPYRGVLRHAGWRAVRVTLPEPTPGHDPKMLAPAEVEL
jgi:hypothetical protein